MSFWIALWKYWLLFTVFFFAGLAVWVTFQGARDIKWMLATLRRQHEESLEREGREN